MFLIIDDNPTDRLIAKFVIQRKYESAEIIEVESAVEGINWLEENCLKKKVSIFLDIRMPEIDGFGFLSLYEKLPSSVKNDSEIIMISSSLDSSDIKKANEHSMVKILIEKPISLEKLNAVV